MKKTITILTILILFSVIIPCNAFDSPIHYIDIYPTIVSEPKYTAPDIPTPSPITPTLIRKSNNAVIIRTQPNNLLAEYVQKNKPITLYQKTQLYPIFLRTINKGNMDGEADAKSDLGMTPLRKDITAPNWASGHLYDIAYMNGYLNLLDLFKLIRM